MRIIKNVLKSELKIRTEMDFPKKGIEFIDINPLIMDRDNLTEIIDYFVSKLKSKKLDYIIAPEARGFLFGSAVAKELGIGCIPVRKKGKLPPSTVECSFDYEKEYGKDILELPKLIGGESYLKKRCFILDDIYATGNTINAIKVAIESQGGKVVGVGAVINIKELNNDKKVLSILDINETG
jgi:adenine phosphoribosyltransferase